MEITAYHKVSLLFVLKGLFLLCAFFRWLKQEFQLDFPVNKQPPLHMPIAYGLVDLTTRRAKSDHAPPLVLSQPTTSGNSSESSLAKKCQYCADGCDDDVSCWLH